MDPQIPSRVQETQSRLRIESVISPECTRFSTLSSGPLDGEMFSIYHLESLYLSFTILFKCALVYGVQCPLFYCSLSHLLSPLGTPPGKCPLIASPSALSAYPVQGQMFSKCLPSLQIKGQ